MFFLNLKGSLAQEVFPKMMNCAGVLKPALYVGGILFLEI
jgi:hypothetical protein